MAPPPPDGELDEPLSTVTTAAGLVEPPNVLDMLTTNDALLSVAASAAVV